MGSRKSSAFHSVSFCCGTLAGIQRLQRRGGGHLRHRQRHHHCVIVVRLQTAFALPESVLLSVAVTALVSGLTIGGKALGKTVALNKSTSVVYWVGRFLHLFHR